MAVDGLSNASLSALAQQILASDADQLITSQELKAFVKSREAQFAGENVDLDTVENQLMVFLKEKYIGEADPNALVLTGNNSGSENSSNDPVSNFNQMKAEVEQYEALLQKYNNDKATLEAQQKTIKDKLDSEQKKFNTLEKEISSENDNYKKIIDAINSATENLEDDVAAKQKSAAYRAMAEYDPDKDGSWSEYISKYMSNLNINSSFSAVLSGLISDADFKSLRLDLLGSKLSTQASTVNDLNTQYKTITNEINGVNSLISATTSKLNAAKDAVANNVLNLISEAEMKLVTDNNLDLNEKLDDGSPRYIFAKGKQDGQYHVYDMKNNGASVPRQYGTQGSGLRGSDICPSGNGYLRDFNKLDENTEGGEEYYYYCGDELKSARACYKTCSPLSFDINGDGVQTSDSVVNFDIDGDGIVDRINDSADAVLVFDKDGDGVSGADGSETFGNNTDIDGDGKADGFKDGFEALKALAKQEGLIDGVNDNELDENDLKVLEEKWGLKIKTGGYNSSAQSLSDAGITNIKLSADNSTVMQDNFDGNGNQLMTQEGATFTVNGEEREYADIWHKKLDASADGADSASAGSNIFSSLSFDLSVSADLANSSIKVSKNAANSAKNSARSSINHIKDNDTFLEYVNRYDPEEAEEEKKKKPEK